MREVAHRDIELESIQFSDGRSMAVTSLIPVFVVSALIGAFAFEWTGLAVASIAFGVSLACFFYLRGKILFAIRRRSDDMLEFQSLRKTHSFDCNEIEAVSVHGLALAFSLVLLVKVSGRLAPVMFYTGALSTSAGGYKETVQAVKKMMQACNANQDGGRPA